jgi:hypothetical protein
MRMEKVKSKAELVKRLQHNTREHVAPNIDAARTKDNLVYGGSVAETMAVYNAKLPDKVRKNAVHAVEIMMTASGKFPGDWKSYLDDCDAWAKKTFGPENVLSIAHHLDETTPHTQVIVMPIKDGKLNARAFIGGGSERMRELQDDFYYDVTNNRLQLSLRRGESAQKTRARHKPHTLAVIAAELEKRSDKAAWRESDLDRREKELEKDQAEIAKWGNDLADYRFGLTAAGKPQPKEFLEKQKDYEARLQNFYVGQAERERQALRKETEKFQAVKKGVEKRELELKNREVETGKLKAGFDQLKIKLAETRLIAATYTFGTSAETLQKRQDEYRAKHPELETVWNAHREAVDRKNQPVVERAGQKRGFSR